MLILVGLAILMQTPAAAPSCTLHRAGADPAAGRSIGSAFAAQWPAAWQRRSQVQRTAIDSAALARAVADLACTASWPGEEDAAIAIALPLFQSRRHGAAAMAAVDGLARNGQAAPATRAAASRLRALLTHAVARSDATTF